MSKPVTENALVTACPGSGLPKADQLRIRPWREHQRRDEPDHADDPQLRRPIDIPCHRDEADPGEREPGGLVAGQRSQPQQHADPEQTRVGQSALAWIAQRPGSSAGTRQERGPRRASSSRAAPSGGRAAGRRPRSGPVPSARVRARIGGHAPLLGDIGREPPGEDRHDRPDEHARHLRGAAGSGRGAAIGIAARNVGSGSQTSKAGRGKTSGGVA